MASGHPAVADNMPSLGVVNGPRPVSPCHSTGTLAPRSGWDEELDSSDFDSNGIANPVRNLDPFMGPSAHEGSSAGQSLYPNLSTYRDLELGTSRTDPTAPHSWHLNLQGQNTLDGEPPAGGGGQPAPQLESRLPPPTPTLDTMSWQIPPRTTLATTKPQEEDLL